MHKKQLILAAVALILAMATVLYFFRLPWAAVNAFEAVPNTSAIVLDFERGDSLISQLKHSNWSTTFEQFYPLQNLADDYKQLDLVFQSAPKSDFRTLPWSTPTVASLQVNALDEVNFLYILNTDKQRFNLKKWVSELTAYSVQTYHYQGEDVYQITRKNAAQPAFAFAAYRGLLLAGRYSLLVEDGLLQLKNVNTNILRKYNFEPLKNTSQSKANCHIYLNTNNLYSVCATWVDATKRQIFDKIPNLATWIGLSFHFETGIVNLKGEILELGNFLKNMDNVAEIHRTESEKIIPDNTAFMTWFEVNDISNALKNATPISKPFRQYLAPWLERQAAYVLTEPHSEDFAAEQFMVFKISDEQQVSRILSQYNKQLKNAQTIDYQMFKIYFLPDSNFIPALSGAQKSSFTTPYYTFLDKFIVFGNSVSAIEIWLDKYVAGQTLSANELYLSFCEAEKKPNNNLFCYLNLSYIQKFVTDLARPDKREMAQKQLAILQQLSCFMVSGSLKKAKMVMKGNMYIKSSVTAQKNDTEVHTSILWKTALDFDAINAPTIVRKNATAEAQIMVQDSTGQLYLMDSSGKIIWKKPFYSKILSPIYALDYYGNEQNYFLFNTKNNIYLIDNQGNNTAAFPIKLQSEATNGVMVTDFDGTKNYSFFVACQNKNIYGFSKNGRPLEGWNPKANVGLVRMPIIHFQKENKDFVTFINQSGSWQCYKRDGTLRWNSKKIDATAWSDLGYQMDSDNPRIVTGDNNGKINVTNTGGESFNLQFKVGNNKNVKFIFSDVCSDARKDYILLSDKDIACYYYKNKSIVNLFEYHFSSPQDELFSIKLHNNNKENIATLCKSKSQISILDERGIPLIGFPLGGSTRFVATDLLRDGSDVLVVGNGNSLCAYKRH